MAVPSPDPALLELIYDAARDPALWPRFLDRLAAPFPAGRGTMYSVDRRRSAVVLANWDPAWTRVHNAHFHSSNPWLPKMRARPAGVTNTAEQMMPTPEFRRSEYFNDFLRPQGIHTGVGATVLRQGGRLVGVSVLHGRDKSDAADVRLLSQLVPHLQRAVEVNIALEGAALSRQADEAVLEQLNHAVAILDGDGIVKFCNRQASALLARPHGPLSLGADGRMEARGTHASTFRSLVRGAAQAASAHGAARPGGWLQCGDEGSPVSVLVAPMRGMPGLMWHAQAAAAVFIFDPREVRPLREGELQQRFALTRTEARVAALLSQGNRPDSIGAALGLKPSTIRQYLKVIYAKTGTNGQLDLVRVLGLTGPG